MNLLGRYNFESTSSLHEWSHISDSVGYNHLQSAYNAHSTETALLKILNDVNEATGLKNATLLAALNPLDVELFFCHTPVGARLIFSMLLLGAELIFANLPLGAGLFFEAGNVETPCEL